MKTEKTISFENFLVERLGIGQQSRTSEGNLYCAQAGVYSEEAKKYPFLDNTGMIFRDISEIFRNRGLGSDVRGSLTFLDGGEDFAIRGLPENTRELCTEDFYDLLREHLRLTRNDLVLDREHYLRTSEGKLVGYCAITWSRLGDLKDSVLLVTLNPTMFESMRD